MIREHVTPILRLMQRLQSDHQAGHHPWQRRLPGHPVEIELALDEARDHDDRGEVGVLPGK